MGGTKEVGEGHYIVKYESISDLSPINIIGNEPLNVAHILKVPLQVVHPRIIGVIVYFATIKLEVGFGNTFYTICNHGRPS